jgi:hypothetical protein
MFLHSTHSAPNGASSFIYLTSYTHPAPTELALPYVELTLLYVKIIAVVERRQAVQHSITILLPDEIYQPLVEAASQQGRTPEEFASERLAQSFQHRPERSNGKGDVTRFFGAVSLGHPTGADNESIDGDLAREYGDNHEGLD